MRRAAPLILLGLLAILAGVGTTYYARLKAQAGDRTAAPNKLAPNTTAVYHGWTYTHTSNEKTVITVHADDFQEVNGKEELSGVKLDIYHKEGDEYDLVTCAKAEFDPGQGILYSDGEVEITLKVPIDQPPSGRLMKIKSSGVRVEVKTSKTSTDRLATFQFDRGDGQAVGADYDPNTRQLMLHSQVQLIWRGTDPKTVPMKVETSQLQYDEKDAKVFLSPWSKLTRGTLAMEGGPATVTLQDGNIHLVETTDAHGTEQQPGRNLQFGAQRLALDFDDNNQVQKITGDNQAHLVATADTTVTTVNSDHVILDFDITDTGSILRAAVSQGHSTMQSKPVLRPGVDPSETRVLKSDTIWTKMRAGGRDVESVETQSAGALEFLPNRPDQPHRWMNGDKIWLAYGPKNELESCRSVSVTTRTEKPKPEDAKVAPAPELTWSKNLLATFQANQLSKLEQSGDFRYQEGDRRARAERAVLDQSNNRIDLVGAARIWDSTGSADADRIVMDQKTGDFSAEGNVSSTRLPDQKKDSSGSGSSDQNGGGMLSQDEPLHGRAKKMVSKDNNLQIRYEGNAVLWQGADRLEADVVEINRDDNLLTAHGNVRSQLLDKKKDSDKPGDTAGSASKPAVTKPAQKDSAKSGKGTASKDLIPSPPATKPAQNVFTVVRAPELNYDDNKRLARYSGGVILERPNMTVKARDIQAFLRNDSDDSSLDHAIANGKVQIHEVAPDRTRDASSEHAEYYVDKDEVILEGGKPTFIDSLRGKTTGLKLTWFSEDDRLLVDGVEKQPVQSVIRSKKK
ncbi:MAG TPA: LptA/OstA family protein [Bryobacteraceae bacterium]|nr:LptA/OstA family protein [Bryobacteraceae bacterium]